ncbi:hypothetical protein MMF93_10105 [Streptomyces tubbatahanensis]|uniref:Integral membrane protein n=1 Tax=Streptomyces tubbatahanensis TaxID=2923272 RepID=A0ABY3XQW6_9ACTN|nr:hypothetical protein [Streptomyces tubbatahanensis]UNS96826.1 hypothetical protein MMF93_10105 [Streptomyces tubbatahanensis]
MSRHHTPVLADGTRPTPAHVHRDAWFPGRRIGGAALVLGPLVWFAGLLLRHLATRAAGFSPEQQTWFDQQPFAAPAQLAAYQAHPALVTAGYACFAGGAVVLCPAFITLARIVAPRCPGLARVGGTLVVVGLFSRLYWAGTDHTAFQLVEELGLDQATSTVLDMYGDISYGPWRVPVTAAFGLYIGTLVLAVGAYRAGTFGTARLLLFLLSGTLWTGVLKESGLFDGVVSAAALCPVLVPLGIRVLRGGVPELPTQGPPATDRGPLRILSW